MEAKKHIFSPAEKHIFKDILRKYENIVESKQTDGSILKAKTTVWDHITREYNANPTTRAQTSTKQLRRLWMNMKQRQRDALRKECQYRLANRTELTNDSVDPDAVTSLLTPELHLPVPGPIDPDTSSEMDNELTKLKVKPEPQENADPTETSDEAGKRRVSQPPNPQHRNPQHPNPQHPNPQQPNPRRNIRSTNFKFWTLGQKKCLIEIMINKKEYQDRKQRAQEIHQIEMEIMKQRLREAKAKADVAEFLLKLQCKDARQENNTDN